MALDSNPRTAIVTSFQNGGSLAVQTTEMLRHTTAHEAAHHLEVAWRTVPPVPSDKLTDSPYYVDLYEHDRYLLNFNWSGGMSTPSTRLPCGSGGPFYMVRNPATNLYVCTGTNGQGTTLNSGYTGLSNVQIAELIFPGYVDRVHEAVGIGVATPIVAGQVYSITLKNSDLPSGFVTVSTTATSTSTANTIAQALVSGPNGFNSYPSLTTIGVSATATGPSVNIIANTAKMTYFSTSGPTLTGTSARNIYLYGAPMSEYFSEKFTVTTTAAVPYNNTDPVVVRFAASYRQFMINGFGACTKTLLDQLVINSHLPASYSARCTSALPATP